MLPYTMKDASGTITHDEMKALVGMGAGPDQDARVAPPAPRSGGDREDQKIPSKSRIATKHQRRKSGY